MTALTTVRPSPDARPCALGLGGDERIEDGRQQGRLDTRSLIDDPKREVIALHYGVDADWRTGRSMRTRVHHQVQQGLGHPVLIADEYHGRCGLDRDPLEFQASRPEVKGFQDVGANTGSLAVSEAVSPRVIAVRSSTIRPRRSSSSRAMPAVSTTVCRESGPSISSSSRCPRATASGVRNSCEIAESS